MANPWLEQRAENRAAAAGRRNRNRGNNKGGKLSKREQDFWANRDQESAYGRMLRKRGIGNVTGDDPYSQWLADQFDDVQKLYGQRLGDNKNLKFNKFLGNWLKGRDLRGQYQTHYFNTNRDAAYADWLQGQGIDLGSDDPYSQWLAGRSGEVGVAYEAALKDNPRLNFRDFVNQWAAGRDFRGEFQDYWADQNREAHFGEAMGRKGIDYYGDDPFAQFLQRRQRELAQQFAAGQGTNPGAEWRAAVDALDPEALRREFLRLSPQQQGARAPYGYGQTRWAAYN